MTKIDLDEIEVSLGYFEDWKKVVAELRQARKVAEAAMVVHKKLSHGYFVTFPTAEWMHLVDELRVYYEKETNDAR